MQDDQVPNSPESQLSAFLDGELPRAEAELFLRRLERSGELKQALSRYALMGEVMRTPANSTGAMAAKGFASRVSEAVAAESSPVPTPAAGDPASASRWWRPLAGMSIAAGVAALAIGLLAQDPEPEQTLVVDTGEAAEAADPSLTEASYIVPEITVTGPLVPAARLTNYVMAHSEYSSALGRRNVLSNMLADEAASPDVAIPAGFVPDPDPALAQP